MRCAVAKLVRYILSYYSKKSAKDSSYLPNKVFNKTEGKLCLPGFNIFFFSTRKKFLKELDEKRKLLPV